MDAVQTLLQRIVDLIINPALLVLFSFALAVFMFGLVRFMWTISQGGERREGTQHMLWGIVGMFIMVSAWGIIALIDNTFGFNSANPDTSRINNITSPANFYGR